MRKLVTCICLLVLVCLGGGGVAFAQQQESRITGLFAGITFERFAELVEKDTRYRFIFKKEEVANVTVNLQANGDKLEDVLGVLFLKSDFSFSISKDLEVFVFKGAKRTVDFLPNYFQAPSGAALSSASVQDEFVRNRRYTIGVPGPGTEARLKGRVTSLENNQPIEGAIVFEKESMQQAVTTKTGEFELLLPKGNKTLFIQNIGGYTEQRLLDIQGDALLELSIGEGVFALNEVVVSSGALSQVARPEMGVQSLSVQEMKRLLRLNASV